MISFSGADINSVYLDALKYFINTKHTISSSRCGDVNDIGPAYFEFYEPNNQLLLIRNRGFNPYFAIIEAAWVLSGSKELAPLKKVIESYSQFSDDDYSLNGAYGYRMKFFFKIDQLKELINLLKDDPNTRRAVVTLFSPEDILNNYSNDIPCNTTLFFKIRGGKLDLTVINRSNDVFLGVPYNAFVFNIVLKYVAYQLNVESGIQRHFSDSLHLYERDIPNVLKIIETNSNEKVQAWKSILGGADDLNDALVKHYNAIVNDDFYCISNAYCKSILNNFYLFKKNKNLYELTASLPNDYFGYCVFLWINSFSKNYVNNNFFDKLYGD